MSDLFLHFPNEFCYGYLGKVGEKVCPVGCLSLVNSKLGLPYGVEGRHALELVPLPTLQFQFPFGHRMKTGHFNEFTDICRRRRWWPFGHLATRFPISSWNSWIIFVIDLCIESKAKFSIESNFWKWTLRQILPFQHMKRHLQEIHEDHLVTHTCGEA